MKTLLKIALVAGLLAAASVALAAMPAADPVIGTWKLNVAKSKFRPGPAPRSQVRSYAATPQGTLLRWTQVGADGKEVTAQVTFRIDGRDYPMTGNPEADSLALIQSDDGTVKSVLKKGGQIVALSLRTISANGKVLTLRTTAPAAASASFDNTLVFEKQ